MVSLHQNVIIHSPAASVWSVLDCPDANRRLNPCFKLLYCAESRLGGYDSAFEYLMAGVRLRGQLRMTAYQPPQQIQYETSGEWLSRWQWWLESDGCWTHAALSVTYTHPVRLIATDPGCLERQTSAVLEQLMFNLRDIAEQRPV
jgi:hypothetical protein